MTDSIPPYQEEPTSPGGWRSVAQLFFVPLLIVVVAGGVFLAMQFLVGDRASPEEILQRVASGDSRRRGQAAYELALRIRAEPTILEDRAFRTQLLAVYERTRGQDAEMRRYLTQVLSMAVLPEATDALLEATRDEDPQTQLYAAAALGNARSAKAFDRLAELTAADDAGLRSVAVVALAALDDPRAVPVLSARLEDGAVEVAWNAAGGLAYLGSPAGEPILRQMLDEEYLRRQPTITEPQMEQAMLSAVEGLARLERAGSDPQRRALLTNAAREAPFERVRGAAMEAVENPQGP